MALKNAELVREIEEMIKKYNKKPDKKITKKDITLKFQNAKILVPCRSDYSDCRIHDEIFGNLFLKPDIVKDGGRTRLLPVFTTYDQIPIDYMEKFSLVRIDAGLAYDFMNESEDVDGIVINPFTDSNLELRKKKTLKSSTRSYVKSAQKPDVRQQKNAIIIYNNEKYSILKSPFTIGRGETDIVISETYISKVHAIISYKDGKYRLADYGSTNGTRLNGKQLKPKVYYELRDGYEIELSDQEKLIIYMN